MHSAPEFHLERDEQSPVRVMLFISLEQEAHNSKPMCVVGGGRRRERQKEGGVTAAAWEIKLKESV